MDLSQRLHALEPGELGKRLPSSAPTVSRRRRRVRRRSPTGWRPGERDHAYVQNPPHVQPPWHAEPWINHQHLQTISSTAYADVIALTIGGGNAAGVPNGYRLFVCEILIWGVHDLATGVDPQLVGRWRILKNRAPAQGLTELRPNAIGLGTSGVAPNTFGFVPMSPLHTPIKGIGGDTLQLQARNTGTNWVCSASMSGFLYPESANGDSLREAWTDKPVPHD